MHPTTSDGTTDSTTGPSKAYALEFAIRMAEAGLRVVPIKAGAKYPDVTEWQTKATDDPSIVRGWLANSKRGVGWAMGRQPNGWNVVAIDVDHHGIDGTQTLTKLIAKNNPRSAAAFTQTVNAVTGGGGAHFVFRLPDGVEVRNTRNLAPGIDVRGEGGQIVCAPTVHPDTGQPYSWNRPPWSHEPKPCPDWVLDMILAEPEPTPEPARKGLSLTDIEGRTDLTSPTDVTPADWVADNFPFLAILEMAGWSVESTRGDEVYLKRPGKTDQGHSAVLHEGRVLNIFSTEAPTELLRIGKQSRDCVSVSAFDFLTAEQFGGDRRAAAKWVRETKMPRPVRTGASAGDSPSGRDDSVEQSSDTVLPDEFWCKTEFLAHVRQAAHSRMVAPGAALVSVLARMAALVPPTVRLPAIIGSSATLDFVGCVVAQSSGGKSISNDLAADLLPSDRKDVLLDLPIGSGEGLVQSFLVPEIDPDTNKPTGKQIVGLNAVHFTVDEGTALMEQSKRQGTTIVQTLCSAWSGRALGQANASAETRRIIEPRRVRVSAVINIQTANGYLLLADHIAAVGLPQRMLFTNAEDPHLPDPLPEWPGKLPFRTPPSIQGGMEMTVDAEIVQELRKHRREVVTGKVSDGPLDGHLGLVQLKVAALFAIADGRLEISLDDWKLAATLRNSSVAIRDQLVAAKQQDDRRRRQAALVGAMEDQAHANDAMTRKLINEAHVTIVTALERHGPVKRKALKEKLRPRHRATEVLTPALEELLALGRIKLADGEYSV